MNEYEKIIKIVVGNIAARKMMEEDAVTILISLFSISSKKISTYEDFIPHITSVTCSDAPGSLPESLLKQATTLPYGDDKKGGMIMKHLHFYKLKLGEKKYIRNWVNWTGEVPDKGDVVLIHFGDYNEEEFMYRVVNRVFNGLRPDHIDIIVEEIEKGGLTHA